MIGSLVEIPGGLKFAVMAMLLAAAGGLTRYYHHVLGTGTFFTHFYYYLPIVLGAIWWKRRGLAVVFLLSAMLVASDHISASRRAWSTTSCGSVSFSWWRLSAFCRPKDWRTRGSRPLKTGSGMKPSSETPVPLPPF